MSLSARRAWIEIKYKRDQTILKVVALRKESVDRNKLKIMYRTFRGSSLSARRAWIEILNAATLRPWTWSLSARRAWIEILTAGGTTILEVWSLSARRAWIEIIHSKHS